MNHMLTAVLYRVACAVVLVAVISVGLCHPGPADEGRNPSPMVFGLAPVVTGNEVTGFGLGARELWEPWPNQTIRLGGTITLRGYQRAFADWRFERGAHRLFLESVYQWRPRDDFYGFGNESVLEQRTSFALRQTWAGMRWEVEPRPILRLGAALRRSWFQTKAGTNDEIAPPDLIFPSLPGYSENLALNNLGVYAALTPGLGSYFFGGTLSAEASYNRGGGESESVRFFSYRAFAEGRVPIWFGVNQLALSVSAASVSKTGESGPIPFYLLPRLGGSEGLRGFRPDRFYGPNSLLTTLEYRHRLHENFDGVLFFDQGDVADEFGNLRLLRGHRGYGAGIRLHSDTRPLMGLFAGRSKEGLYFHFALGNPRNSPPASQMR